MSYLPLSPTGYSSITETPRMSTPSTSAKSHYEINDGGDEAFTENGQTIENLLQALYELSSDQYVQRHQENLDRVGSVYAIAGCQDQLQPGPDGQLHWERHYYCRGNKGTGYIYCKELTLDMIRLREDQTERLPTAITLYQAAAEKYHDPVVWVDTFTVTAQDGSEPRVRASYFQIRVNSALRSKRGIHSTVYSKQYTRYRVRGENTRTSARPRHYDIRCAEAERTNRIPRTTTIPRNAYAYINNTTTATF